MNAICFFKQYHVKPFIDGDGLKLSGLSSLTERDAQSVIRYAKSFRERIVEELSNNSSDFGTCKAAATWDYGPYKDKGLLCFYDAMFRGRAGKPVPCSVAKCRKTNQEGNH